MAARNAREPRKHTDWEIYALAAGPLPPRLRVAGRLLHVFAVGPVAVIAAPPQHRAKSTEDALRAQHAVVLALAERVDPLLPARFGSRLTAARLEATLRPSVDALMTALAHVRGRRQMTVRLAGPPDGGGPQRIEATGTAYLAQRLAAAHEIPAQGAPLRAAVDRFVVDERVRPGRGGIRATLFHLVERRDVQRYLRAAEGVVPAMAPWSAAVSGPWPPFAFAPELLE